ncbi:MAG: type II toxin-antitoxin system VapC family toxin [Alphaproteobacteria bacterium]|nr:type II toxin-antitoxin system VapC family toxin [Alphaproteobacteria bacterium]MBV8412185.1 type II toxin-antitoxin system VapC family toxin [Alphaproteobacteria bacterium]
MIALTSNGCDDPSGCVLIYAFRKDSRRHPEAKSWLEAMVASDAPFGVSSLAFSAVVRIVTNPRAFANPSHAAEVFEYCDALLGQPNCEIVHPGDSHWTIFRRLCLETATRGTLVTDAWFAALAIEHGCTWATYDRDFARFPGLDLLRLPL